MRYAHPTMPRCLVLTSFLVPDFAEAIAWFTRLLRFELLEEAPLGASQRLVMVASGPERPDAAGVADCRSQP